MFHYSDKPKHIQHRSIYQRRCWDLQKGCINTIISSSIHKSKTSRRGSSWPGELYFFWHGGRTRWLPHRLGRHQHPWTFTGMTLVSIFLIGVCHETHKQRRGRERDLCLRVWRWGGDLESFYIFWCIFERLYWPLDHT